MKKATITLSYDGEKLSALRLYLEQKGGTLEEELQQAVDTLYAKTIPANVRGFLDLRAGVVKPESKDRKAKPKAEALAPEVSKFWNRDRDDRPDPASSCSNHWKSLGHSGHPCRRCL